MNTKKILKAKASFRIKTKGMSVGTKTYKAAAKARNRSIRKALFG